MRYHRAIPNVIYTQHNCGMMCFKRYPLKELHILVKSLNKIDNKLGYWIFGVCNEFMRKLTEYFFGFIVEVTAYLGNTTLFTSPKKIYIDIKIGPMYIVWLVSSL